MSNSRRAARVVVSAAAVVVVATCALTCAPVDARDGWFFGRQRDSGAQPAAPYNRRSELELESPSLEQPQLPRLHSGGPQQNLFRSPVAVGQQLQMSRLFAANGRLPASSSELQQWREADLFQCADHRQLSFETFVRQYNRSFADEPDRLERWNLFHFTLKRAIMFNRIIQNEFLNATNYQVKPEIRNYHFVEPLAGASNAALWYADITDCELGLIKNIVFELFHRVETNDLAYAYKLLEGNRHYLPTLFNDDGFEQLANILLVRLYDRFQGDEPMNKLFEWPLYLKRLASFVYGQRQAAQPGFKAKMALVAFAYPAYFKDLKYNAGAINRTADNLHANDEHKRFNAAHERKFSTLAERNKRLAIFRQRWTLLSHLNDEQYAGALNVTNAQLIPDWLRVRYLDRNELWPTGAEARNRSAAKLLLDGADGEADNFVSSQRTLRAYPMTQFSDLTDVEFVAFLSNDYSLLENNRDSQSFLERNFRLRPLDARFRWELAAELELRRAAATSSAKWAALQANNAFGESGELEPQAQGKLAARPSLQLAKQVIDELISDVGLPIGPAAIDGISEEQHYRMFESLARAFNKVYMASPTTAAGSGGRRLSAAELADERQRRYEIFKQNHGRFLAWQAKEGWQLDEAQQVNMLRLADMTWLELKLAAFKVCCLSEANMADLSAQNATLAYLSSHTELVCGAPMHEAAGNGQSGPLQQQHRSQTDLDSSLREVNALELYYYYSVHFNKHHLGSGADFQRRLDIFRRNFDAIRRHSCRRSLTLYESFRLKKPDILSTIDVIDPRRSHTDDLNLDRFEYFRLPGSESVAELRDDLVRVPSGAASSFESSRAGVSYRREPFASLLNRRHSQAAHSATRPLVYLDRLVGDSLDANEYASRYARNNVRRVYDLVVARYKFCMNTIGGVDLEERQVRQKCHSSGPLADQAAQSPLYPSFESATAGTSGRLQSANAAGEPAHCKFYWEGLEPWAASLTPQDGLSAQLIREAKCLA